MTIPASRDVSVLPGVVSAGGNPLSLNTVMLTTNPDVPVGSVLSFGTAADVAAYLGNASAEYPLASIYFNGFDGSSKKPGMLYLARFVGSSPVAAYIRSGSFAKVALSTLQGTNGTLTLTIDGVPHTVNINLAAATSFSNAATIMQTALTGFCTVVYSLTTNAFVFTSLTTGVSSTMDYATGSIADNLLLRQADGAVLSQGAVSSVIRTFMDSLVSQVSNWATFTTVFTTSNAKTTFSQWVSLQNSRYLYVCWDSDPNAAVNGNTTNFGYLSQSANYNGVCLVWNSKEIAAFVCGMIGSIDWAAANGRITAKFKSQAGLVPSVTDNAVADVLTANGYNFYGAYATANQSFQYFAEGSIFSPFLWLDTYVAEIYLNSQFQLALLELMTNINAIPYNAEGYALIGQAMNDPIQEALNNGTIRAGVTLSSLQAAEVNQQAGLKISDIISQQGWYFQVQPASAQVRAQRQTPVCYFWYTDGGAIHRITLSSLDIL